MVKFPRGELDLLLRFEFDASVLGEIVEQIAHVAGGLMKLLAEFGLRIFNGFDGLDGIVIGGEGWIQIVEEQAPDKFVERPRLVTAEGAKTSLLVPRLNALFVAVSPGESKAMARVLRIDLGK